MGSAAYRRGSAAIRASLLREQMRQEFRFIEELNAVPKDEGARTPLAPIRIGYDKGLKAWWLQDAGKGDADWGYCYPSLWALMRRWQITITGYDATTGIYTAMPRSEPRSP